MNAFTIALIVVGAVAGVAAIFGVVTFVLATLSGWKSLAQRRPDRDVPLVQRFRWQSLRVNRVSYNNCVAVDVTTEGVRFRVMWPFSHSHAPVLLPWGQFAVQRGKAFKLVPVVTIVPDDPRDVTIRITSRLAEQIESVAGEYWRAALDRAAVRSSDA
ncbi:MAG: hypothetical protein KDA44_03350 [Planctomycetales bacterium]|nr:hypothetical protein [Planctomycetales bacterium]